MTARLLIKDRNRQVTCRLLCLQMFQQHAA